MSKTIALSQGKEAIVDDADYEMLSKFKWCAVKDCHVFYAARTIKIGEKRKLLKMHPAIMGNPPAHGMQIDHKNGNGLDNQRESLRWSNSSQNKMNQRKTRGISRFKGISWNGRVKRWYARICKNQSRIHLGFFTDEVSAAIAYDAAAKELFGEFAKTYFGGE